MAMNRGKVSQDIVIQAIEEYTERHSSNINVIENGINDMNTLAKCQPRELVSSTTFLIN
jgi:hypothetical protein